MNAQLMASSIANIQNQLDLMTDSIRPEVSVDPQIKSALARLNAYCLAEKNMVAVALVNRLAVEIFPSVVTVEHPQDPTVTFTPSQCWDVVTDTENIYVTVNADQEDDFHSLLKKQSWNAWKKTDIKEITCTLTFDQLKERQKETAPSHSNVHPEEESFIVANPHIEDYIYQRVNVLIPKHQRKKATELLMNEMNIQTRPGHANHLLSVTMDEYVKLLDPATNALIATWEKVSQQPEKPMESSKTLIVNKCISDMARENFVLEQGIQLTGMTPELLNVCLRRWPETSTELGELLSAEGYVHDDRNPFLWFIKQSDEMKTKILFAACTLIEKDKLSQV